jgi:hypothetical protein
MSAFALGSALRIIEITAFNCFALPYALKLLGTKIDGLILSQAVVCGLWTRGSPNDQYCFFVGTSRIHQAGI